MCLRGLLTSAAGNLVIPGLSAGNVFVGVQPLLGVEGDPMRLLFERDLTPHPQYAAFYKWLQHVSPVLVNVAWSRRAMDYMVWCCFL